MQYSVQIGRRKASIVMDDIFVLPNIYLMRRNNLVNHPHLTMSFVFFSSCFRLPTRSYLHHYVIDVPLTNRGRMHAFKTGKSLLANGYQADICYTSPSLRCVQSADGILNGMGRKQVPMKLVCL